MTYNTSRHYHTAKTGVVDDARDSSRESDGPEKYVVTDTWYDDGKRIGAVDPERVRELLRKCPDASRVFEMVTGAGHEHAVGEAVYTQAEHAGRVETDPERLIRDLTGDDHSCRVRLDTTGPQLVTVSRDAVRGQIEVDDSVVCWVPPPGDARSD